MDNTQVSIIQGGNSNPPGSNQVTNQPLVNTPPSPVSPPQKEQVEPILGQATSEAILKPEGWIEPSEKEPQIHPEVAEAGVERVSSTPELTPEAQKTGLRLAKESTPVSTQPSGAVQLPISEQKSKNILRFHKKVANSVTWLAVLVLKHFKKIHRKITS